MTTIFAIIFHFDVCNGAGCTNCVASRRWDAN